MRNLFILFTLTCLISNAQRIKRVILIDVTSKEPIPLFSVKLNNDSIVYTNLNGKLLVNSSNTLYFDNEIYESLTLKANDISDTIFLHPKNHLLEELVINKKSVDKEILPFYKNITSFLPHLLDNHNDILFDFLDDQNVQELNL